MRPLRLAAASFLVILAACGDATPRAPGRTAAQWAADLDSPAVEKSARAAQELRSLAAEQGPAVTDALVAALSRVGPPTDAASFSVRLDAPEAVRLGLEAVDAPDAIALVLPVVRRRIVDRGLTLGSLRGSGEGVIDVILVGALPAEDVARIARDVCRRGAIEFRAFFVPPRIDAAAAKEFASWREAEIRAFERAGKEGAAYAPTRANLRVVRDATVPEGATTPGFAVVVEPAGPADAFDERVAAGTIGFVGTDGRARVRIAVAPARQTDLTRFTTPLVGREVAVVRDGVVAERLRVTVPWTASIDVLAAGEPSTPPDEMARARADASAIALGRLPRPLAPVPAGEARTTAELLAPSLERAILAIGSAAIPALERLASADVEAPRKSLVARALTTLRTRAEREEEAAREEKIRAAKAKEKPPEGEADPRDAAANGDGEPAPPK